ncbi:MAG: tetratricopeptide repeat protein [Myxococcota bacterium]
MKTRALSFVVAALFGLSSVAHAASPLPAPPPPPPAKKDDKKKESLTKSGPNLGAVSQQRQSRLSSKDTEKSLKASIKNQEEILELEDRNSPSYAKQAIALADFYWDFAEFYGNRAYSEDIEKPMYDAQQKGDTETENKWKIEQQRALDFQKKYQEETIKRYRDVLAKYKSAANRDQIRYFLAYNLVAMGRGEEGAEEYAKIITEFRDSPYVPDALVNIGDYYFDINDFTNAQKLYQKAQEEQYQQANVYGYAIYKEAWCLYNMGDYDTSLKRFIQVIEIADKRANDGQKGAIPLRRESQNEMTLPYSKVKKPEGAIAFFKQYAPDRYLEIAGRLATIYTEQSEFVKSSILLKLLMAEARSGNINGQDVSYMVIQFQRQVVNNAVKPGDKPTTVAEIAELIRIYEEMADKAPAEFRDSERDEIKRTILEVAQDYHTEYARTREQKTLEYTQRLYDEYLRVFRNDDNSYLISMNNAKLMLLTDKFEEAASEFEAVIAMNPEGEYADAAAELSVLAYLKTIQVAKPTLKDEANEDLKPLEIPPPEKRFVTAIDRWMLLIQKHGENPETKDNVPVARYASGKVLYNYNHFPEAAQRFADFLEKHPGHPLENDARRLLLSAYNLAHDVDHLREYANKFDAIPTLPVDLKEDIKKIKNAFNFQECFKIQEAKKPLEAAGCFEKYAQEFPNEERTVAALYNASLNYFEAKRVEKALETQRQLYEQHKNHELGPKALYAIGEIYRQTTVYESASQWYEFLVKNHPDHPLAEKALRYASIFRKTLGQNKEAIANLERYLQKYPKEANAPRVDLDIIFILEKQEKWKDVVTRAERHLKRFADESPSVRLQVLNRRGLALLKQPGKAKDAQVAFQDTVDAYNRLDDRYIRDLDLAGIAAVAESHFNLGEVDLQKARSIKLEAPTEAASKKALSDKLAILGQVKDKYEKVIGYQHPGWVIAASAQLGLAYQDLADAVENAPVPKSIVRQPEVVDAFKQLMAEQAQKIRENAIVNYRRALDTAKQFRWFNDYSEKAERAIAQLDLTDLSVKEFRVRPDQLTPNAGVPDFRGGGGPTREPKLPDTGPSPTDPKAGGKPGDAKTTTPGGK